MVAAVLAALLAWYAFSDTALRLGDRSLRVYDVRDLVVDVPDFPFPDVGGDDEEPKSRDERVRELAEEIRAHVAPGTWGEADLVNFAEGLRLLVVTSEAKHRLIQDYFEQIRAAQRVQVTVEARFIELDEASARQVESVLAAAGKAAGAEGPPLFLDDAVVTAVLRVTQAGSGNGIVTAPRITLFNGQRAHVVVETQRSIISNVTVNQAADGAVQYVPTVETVGSGVLLDTRATASADRRHVTLYLHPRLTTLRGIENVDLGNGPDGKELSIQSPNLWVAEIHQTVTVPDGRTMLIRNISKPADAASRPVAGREDAPHEVMLLVKATIIDPAKPPPGAGGGLTFPATRPAGGAGSP